jgi:predicted alpha/beta hydrolase family esterase
VLLHGIDGSGPGHWQRWLADELTDAGREVRFPDLPDASAPELDPWLDAIDASLSGLNDDGFDVVAHSLGAIAWLHHAVRWSSAREAVAASAEAGPLPARVALVAPPSPDRLKSVAPGFEPVPMDIDAVRRAADGTVLVGGDNDPHCPDGIARVYGVPLKMAATVIPGGGHLNTASGYGPWPAVLDWCRRDNLAFIS